MPLAEHAAHWANYLGELVREFPLHYPSWRQVPAEQKAGIMAQIGIGSGMIQGTCRATQNNKTGAKARSYYADKDPTVSNAAFEIMHEGMLRLQGLGSNTETGVPYTKDEIMAIVQRGKQRGYILGVGRVLPEQGTVIPPPPPSTHSSDVVKLKKREKVLTRQGGEYQRILIEIIACNDFSDNLVMAIPNMEGTGYTKETIRVEYEWKPPRCSVCLLFGHFLHD
ncbi:hypothetical protein Tco_0294703 [Tanacetum coccineum]